MIDGGGGESGYGRTTNVKFEAAFSPDTRRSHWSTQAKSAANTTSSWDDSWESEPDIVGTINQGETPRFNVDEHGVVHETAMNETLDEFQEAWSDWDLNCPLISSQFMFKLLERLRKP